MRYSSQLAVSLAATLALSWAGPVSLGRTAQINGKVTDSTDAAVPSVSIDVVSLQTGTSRKTRTNEEGSYIVPLLPPGTYRMTVQKDGFRTLSRSGIKLSADQVARIDFVLQSREISDSVEEESVELPLYEPARLFSRSPESVKPLSDATFTCRDLAKPSFH